MMYSLIKHIDAERQIIKIKHTLIPRVYKQLGQKHLDLECINNSD